MHILINIVLVAILTTITIAQKVDQPCVLVKNNSSGTCKFAKDCPEVDRLTSEGEHVQLCGFYLSIRPIFCCPNTPTPMVEVTTVSNVDEADAINYTKQMCAEYSKNYTMRTAVSNLAPNSVIMEKIVPNCDKNSKNLISLGDKTELKEFPFAASLGQKVDNTPIVWFCGGSLISDRFVLTAAHCLTGRRIVSVVRLGDYNLTDDKDGAMHRDYLIEPPIIHPEYASNVAYHDIALLKLTETVIFTDFIKPACLWPEPSKIIKNSTIAIGWGDTEYAGSGSDVLLKVGLQVYDNSFCQGYYSNDIKLLPNGLTSNILCAGDTKSEKDTCPGDSGGPLVKIDEENSCIQYIVGITSHGKACGVKESVAIYTRVTSYLGWIVNELKKN